MTLWEHKATNIENCASLRQQSCETSRNSQFENHFFDEKSENLYMSKLKLSVAYKRAAQAIKWYSFQTLHSKWQKDLFMPHK